MLFIPAGWFTAIGRMSTLRRKILREGPGAGGGAGEAV